MYQHRRRGTCRPWNRRRPSATTMADSTMLIHPTLVSSSRRHPTRRRWPSSTRPWRRPRRTLSPDTGTVRTPTKLRTRRHRLRSLSTTIRLRSGSPFRPAGKVHGRRPARAWHRSSHRRPHIRTSRAGRPSRHRRLTHSHRRGRGSIQRLLSRLGHPRRSRSRMRRHSRRRPNRAGVPLRHHRSSSSRRLRRIWP